MDIETISGDGPVLVKSLTARRQHEDSGHTEPAYNAGLMDGEKKTELYISQKLSKMIQKSYPLYDVPWLVRDPNAFRMSEKRHQIEVRNQAVVDDYFVARDKGVPAHEAREVVATKYGIKPKSVRHALDWFFHEAKKRRKYDFLQKFSHEMEH